MGNKKNKEPLGIEVELNNLKAKLLSLHDNQVNIEKELRCVKTRLVNQFPLMKYTHKEIDDMKKEQGIKKNPKNKHIGC